MQRQLINVVRRLRRYGRACLGPAARPRAERRLVRLDELEPRWVPALSHPSELDLAPWSTQGATVAADVTAAPDGSQTADKLVESATAGYHQDIQYFDHATGGLSASIHVKAGERTRAELLLYNAAQGVYGEATLDLLTGSLVSNYAGTATVASDGGGWWKLSVWANATQTNSGFFVRAVQSPQNTSYAGDGTSGLYAWGAAADAQASPPPSNLVKFPDALNVAPWFAQGAAVAADAAAAPDGTPTADKLVEGRGTGVHQVVQVFNHPTGGLNTTVYLKAGERTRAQLLLWDAAEGTFGEVTVDLAYGSVVTNGAGVASIQNAGNGWWQVMLWATSTQTSSGLYIRAVQSPQNTSYAGDGTSGLYAWGVSVDPQAKPSPGDGNFLRAGNSFNLSPWFTQNATVAPDAAVAPDGTPSADKIVEGTGNDYHQVVQYFDHPVGGLNTTVYLKAAERAMAEVVVYDPGAQSSSSAAAAQAIIGDVVVDLSAGTVVANWFGIASVQSAGNGWWQVTMWSKSTTVNTGLYVRTYTPPENHSYPGDGASGIYAWGARVAPQQRPPSPGSLPPGYQSQVVTYDLEGPTSMRFAPDGRLFVTEKAGDVRVIENGQLLPQPFLSLNVDTYSERGLENIIFDPDFAHNGYVYVYYTTADPANPGVPNNRSADRLSRFRADPNNPDVVDTAFGEQVMLDGVSAAAGYHNAGSMEFGPDGTLYLGTGDAGNAANAQNLDSFNGKVLRLNVSGTTATAPPDNPFYNAADGITPRDFVWVYGMRNPFTGDVDPVTHKIYVNNVGFESYEEVNDVTQPGGNYGWPTHEGYTTDPAYVSPVYAYPHGAGASATGGAFYEADQFPGMRGKYLFADYVQSWIRVFDPATGTVSDFAANVGGTVNLKVDAAGNLYTLDILTGTVRKISYVGAGNVAPTAVAAVDRTDGLAPLTVRFDGTASSDPNGDALSYTWDFGDGTTGTGPVAVHQYMADGVYDATLTVADRPDGTGLSNTSPPLRITVGNRAPTGTVTAPANGSSYVGGQTINLAATGTDPEDGNLPASAFNWAVEFHHNTHTHPLLEGLGGPSGTFTIPAQFEPDPDQWIRVYLTVTDSGGLQQTSFVDILPQTSTFTLASNVSGALLLLDAEPEHAPVSTRGVVGQTRQISAPTPQTVNGTTYRFASWSDGGAATHDITIPAADTTFTATFVQDYLPAAQNDSYSTNSNSPLAVGAAAGVLANDSDPDGEALAAALVSGPSHGSLTLNPDGSFTYSPEANYGGTDSFTYRVSDPSAAGNTATVSLTVVNLPPAAQNDSYTTTSNTPLAVGAAAGVLANDSDPEGEGLSAALASGPGHGALTLNADGSFSYSPAAGYSGSDTFTYQVSDPSGPGNTATVTITVVAPPAVTAVTPAGGALDVPAGAAATATFSKPMNGTTVNSSTVVLTRGGVAVPATVSYDPVTFKVTLTPSAPLLPSSKYVVTVKGGAAGVKDTSGYAMAADKVWSFVTTAAGQNLIQSPSALNLSPWLRTGASVSADVATAPDGTQSADKVVESTANGYHQAYQSFAHAAGRVTASVYLKAAERTRAEVLLYNAAEAVYGEALVDLSGGAVVTNSKGTLSVQNTGNGWWQVTLTATSAQTGSTLYVRTIRSPQDTSYPGTGTSGIYAWGARVEQGNLVAAGNSLNLAAWTKQNASASGNVAAAPDGTQTAGKLVESTATGYHQATQSFDHPAGEMLASVYLKAGGRTRAEVLVYNAAEGVYGEALVDLSTGAVVTNWAGAVSVQSTGNGWWRVTLKVSSAQSRSTLYVRTVRSPQDTSYAGDGVSGLYVWGARVDALG